jgi:hypothetical protein
MSDINVFIGVTLVVIAILGALALGYAVGYNIGNRRWR